MRTVHEKMLRYNYEIYAHLKTWLPTYLSCIRCIVQLLDAMMNHVILMNGVDDLSCSFCNLECELYFPIDLYLVIL